MGVRHHAADIGPFGPLARALAGFSTAWRSPRATAALKSSLFCIIGLAGGVFGGLLGIGGGSVIAPLLLVTTGLRASQVSGTTLATVLVISAIGVAAYASLGHLSLGLAWPIAAGSAAGAVLGAMMSGRLSQRWMGVIFVVILPYFTLKEFFPSLAAPDMAADVLTLGLLGAVTGFLSGLLGISGASLVVPSLVAFFLIDHHTAQGIAIGVALADSLAGTAAHSRKRTIDRRVFLLMAIPALFGALVGALLSDLLSSVALRYIFGVFMLAIWGLMLVRLVGFLTVKRSEERVLDKEKRL